MDDQNQKKMQETLLLGQQLALMKGENFKLKSELVNISDASAPGISENQVKGEIMQIKRDSANINLALNKKSLQIIELERDIIKEQIDSVSDELTAIEAKQTIIKLKNDNERILKEIQKTKELISANQSKESSNRFCLSIEGQPSMSTLMTQLESEVQQLNNKLSTLPKLNLEVC